jgi:hypothetical protein
MKVNTKSYPHPVLGNGDDIQGSFKAVFTYELCRETVILNPVFALENKTVENLVKKGKAAFVTEAECRSTFFRASFSSTNPSEKFVIPAKILRERVSVGFYICANEDIKNYKPEGCHADYEGMPFEIEKGDVLAVGGGCDFIAEKNFDPLRPPVSSFMSIREGRLHEGPIEIDYTSDKITIELSKSDWQNYGNIRSQKVAEGALHASVVLPVLVDAIYKVQTEASNYGDQNWFGRLDAILDSKGLKKREPFEAAQKILDNPSARNFQSINSMLGFNSAEDNG